MNSYKQITLPAGTKEIDLRPYKLEAIMPSGNGVSQARLVSVSSDADGNVVFKGMDMFSGAENRALLTDAEFRPLNEEALLEVFNHPQRKNLSILTESTYAGFTKKVSEGVRPTPELTYVPADQTASEAARNGGVDTLRHPDANGMHYSNPSSHEQERMNHTLIKASSVEQASTDYLDWLTGARFLNVEPARRSWIVRNILSGELYGKPMFYYTDRIPTPKAGDDWAKGFGQEVNYSIGKAPNHAHMLLYLVNHPDFLVERMNAYSAIRNRALTSEQAVFLFRSLSVTEKMNVLSSLGDIRQGPAVEMARLQLPDASAGSHLFLPADDDKLTAIFESFPTIVQSDLIAQRQVRAEAAQGYFWKSEIDNGLSQGTAQAARQDTAQQNNPVSNFRPEVSPLRQMAEENASNRLIHIVPVSVAFTTQEILNNHDKLYVVGDQAFKQSGSDVLNLPELRMRGNFFELGTMRETPRIGASPRWDETPEDIEVFRNRIAVVFDNLRSTMMLKAMSSDGAGVTVCLPDSEDYGLLYSNFSGLSMEQTPELYDIMTQQISSLYYVAALYEQVVSTKGIPSTKEEKEALRNKLLREIDANFPAIPAGQWAKTFEFFGLTVESPEKDRTATIRETEGFVHEKEKVEVRQRLSAEGDDNNTLAQNQDMSDLDETKRASASQQQGNGYLSREEYLAMRKENRLKIASMWFNELPLNDKVAVLKNTKWPISDFDYLKEARTMLSTVFKLEEEESVNNANLNEAFSKLPAEGRTYIYENAKGGDNAYRQTAMAFQERIQQVLESVKEEKIKDITVSSYSSLAEFQRVGYQLLETVSSPYSPKEIEGATVKEKAGYYADWLTGKTDYSPRQLRSLHDKILSGKLFGQDFLVSEKTVHDDCYADEIRSYLRKNPSVLDTILSRSDEGWNKFISSSGKKESNKSEQLKASMEAVLGQLSGSDHISVSTLTPVGAEEAEFASVPMNERIAIVYESLSAEAKTAVKLHHVMQEGLYKNNIDYQYPQFPAPEHVLHHYVENPEELAKIINTSEPLWLSRADDLESGMRAALNKMGPSDQAIVREMVPPGADLGQFDSLEPRKKAEAVFLSLSDEGRHLVMTESPVVNEARIMREFKALRERRNSSVQEGIRITNSSFIDGTLQKDNINAILSNGAIWFGTYGNDYASPFQGKKANGWSEQDILDATERWLTMEDYVEVEPEKRDRILNDLFNGNLIGKEIAVSETAAEYGKWFQRIVNDPSGIAERFVVSLMSKEKASRLRDISSKYLPTKVLSSVEIGARYEINRWFSSLSEEQMRFILTESRFDVRSPREARELELLSTVLSSWADRPEIQKENEFLNSLSSEQKALFYEPQFGKIEAKDRKLRNSTLKMLRYVPFESSVHNTSLLNPEQAKALKNFNYAFANGWETRTREERDSLVAKAMATLYLNDAITPEHFLIMAQFSSTLPKEWMSLSGRQRMDTLKEILGDEATIDTVSAVSGVRLHLIERAFMPEAFASLNEKERAEAFQEWMEGKRPDVEPELLNTLQKWIISGRLYGEDILVPEHNPEDKSYGEIRGFSYPSHPCPELIIKHYIAHPEEMADIVNNNPDIWAKNKKNIAVALSKTNLSPEDAAIMRIAKGDTSQMSSAQISTLAAFNEARTEGWNNRSQEERNELTAKAMDAIGGVRDILTPERFVELSALQNSLYQKPVEVFNALSDEGKKAVMEANPLVVREQVTLGAVAGELQAKMLYTALFNEMSDKTALSMMETNQEFLSTNNVSQRRAQCEKWLSRLNFTESQKLATSIGAIIGDSRSVSMNYMKGDYGKYIIDSIKSAPAFRDPAIDNSAIAEYCQGLLNELNQEHDESNREFLKELRAKPIKINLPGFENISFATPEEATQYLFDRRMELSEQKKEEAKAKGTDGNDEEDAAELEEPLSREAEGDYQAPETEKSELEILEEAIGDEKLESVIGGPERLKLVQEKRKEAKAAHDKLMNDYRNDTKKVISSVILSLPVQDQMRLHESITPGKSEWKEMAYQFKVSSFGIFVHDDSEEGNGLNKQTQQDAAKIKSLFNSKEFRGASAEAKEAMLDNLFATLDTDSKEMIFQFSNKKSALSHQFDELTPLKKNAILKAAIKSSAGASNMLKLSKKDIETISRLMQPGWAYGKTDIEINDVLNDVFENLTITGMEKVMKCEYKLPVATADLATIPNRIVSVPTGTAESITAFGILQRFPPSLTGEDGKPIPTTVIDARTKYYQENCAMSKEDLKSHCQNSGIRYWDSSYGLNNIDKAPEAYREQYNHILEAARKGGRVIILTGANAPRFNDVTFTLFQDLERDGFPVMHILKGEKTSVYVKQQSQVVEEYVNLTGNERIVRGRTKDILFEKEIKDNKKEWKYKAGEGVSFVKSAKDDIYWLMPKTMANYGVEHKFVEIKGVNYDEMIRMAASDCFGIVFKGARFSSDTNIAKSVFDRYHEVPLPSNREDLRNPEVARSLAAKVFQVRDDEKRKKGRTVNEEGEEEFIEKDPRGEASLTTYAASRLLRDASAPVKVFIAGPNEQQLFYRFRETSGPSLNEQKNDETKRDAFDNGLVAMDILDQVSAEDYEIFCRNFMSSFYDFCKYGIDTMGERKFKEHFEQEWGVSHWDMSIEPEIITCGQPGIQEMIVNSCAYHGHISSIYHSDEYQVSTTRENYDAKSDKVKSKAYFLNRFYAGLTRPYDEAEIQARVQSQEIDKRIAILSRSDNPEVAARLSAYTNLWQMGFSHADAYTLAFSGQFPEGDMQKAVFELIRRAQKGNRFVVPADWTIGAIRNQKELLGELGLSPEATTDGLMAELQARGIRYDDVRAIRASMAICNDGPAYDKRAAGYDVDGKVAAILQYESESGLPLTGQNTTTFVEKGNNIGIHDEQLSKLLRKSDEALLVLLRTYKGLPGERMMNILSAIPGYMNAGEKKFLTPDDVHEFISHVNSLNEVRIPERISKAEVESAILSTADYQAPEYILSDKVVAPEVCALLVKWFGNTDASRVLELVPDYTLFRGHAINDAPTLIDLLQSDSVAALGLPSISELTLDNVREQLVAESRAILGRLDQGVGTLQSGEQWYPTGLARTGGYQMDIQYQVPMDEESIQRMLRITEESDYKMSERNRAAIRILSFERPSEGETVQTEPAEGNAQTEGPAFEPGKRPIVVDVDREDGMDLLNRAMMRDVPVIAYSKEPEYMNTFFVNLNEELKQKGGAFVTLDQLTSGRVDESVISLIRKLEPDVDPKSESVTKDVAESATVRKRNPILIDWDRKDGLYMLRRAMSQGIPAFVISKQAGTENPFFMSLDSDLRAMGGAFITRDAIASGRVDEQTKKTLQNLLKRYATPVDVVKELEGMGNETENRKALGESADNPELKEQIIQKFIESENKLASAVEPLDDVRMVNGQALSDNLTLVHKPTAMPAMISYYGNAALINSTDNMGIVSFLGDMRMPMEKAVNSHLNDEGAAAARNIVSRLNGSERVVVAACIDMKSGRSAIEQALSSGIPVIAMTTDRLVKAKENGLVQRLVASGNVVLSMADTMPGVERQELLAQTNHCLAAMGSSVVVLEQMSREHILANRPKEDFYLTPAAAAQSAWGELFVVTYGKDRTAELIASYLDVPEGERVDYDALRRSLSAYGLMTESFQSHLASGTFEQYVREYRDNYASHEQHAFSGASSLVREAGARLLTTSGEGTQELLKCAKAHAPEEYARLRWGDPEKEQALVGASWKISTDFIRFPVYRSGEVQVFVVGERYEDVRNAIRSAYGKDVLFAEHDEKALDMVLKKTSWQEQRREDGAYYAATCPEKKILVYSTLADPDGAVYSYENSPNGAFNRTVSTSKEQQDIARFEEIDKAFSRFQKTVYELAGYKGEPQVVPSKGIWVKKEHSRKWVVLQDGEPCAEVFLNNSNNLVCKDRQEVVLASEEERSKTLLLFDHVTSYDEKSRSKFIDEKKVIGNVQNAMMTSNFHNGEDIVRISDSLESTVDYLFADHGERERMIQSAESYKPLFAEPNLDIIVSDISLGMDNGNIISQEDIHVRSLNPAAERAQIDVLDRKKQEYETLRKERMEVSARLDSRDGALSEQQRTELGEKLRQIDERLRDMEKSDILESRISAKESQIAEHEAYVASLSETRIAAYASLGKESERIATRLEKLSKAQESTRKILKDLKGQLELNESMEEDNKLSATDVRDLEERIAVEGDSLACLEKDIALLKNELAPYEAAMRAVCLSDSIRKDGEYEVRLNAKVGTAVFRDARRDALQLFNDILSRARGDKEVLDRICDDSARSALAEKFKVTSLGKGSGRKGEKTQADATLLDWAKESSVYCSDIISEMEGIIPKLENVNIESGNDEAKTKEFTEILKEGLKCAKLSEVRYLNIQSNFSKECEGSGKAITEILPESDKFLKDVVKHNIKLGNAMDKILLGTTKTRHYDVYLVDDRKVSVPRPGKKLDEKELKAYSEKMEQSRGQLVNAIELVKARSEELEAPMNIAQLITEKGTRITLDNNYTVFLDSSYGSNKIFIGSSPNHQGYTYFKFENKNWVQLTDKTYFAVGKFKVLGGLVTNEDGKQNLLNRRGEEVVPQFVDRIHDVYCRQEGMPLVCVELDGKYNLVDFIGKKLLNEEWLDEKPKARFNEKTQSVEILNANEEIIKTIQKEAKKKQEIKNGIIKAR